MDLKISTVKKELVRDDSGYGCHLKFYSFFKGVERVLYSMSRISHVTRTSSFPTTLLKVERIWAR